MALKKTHIQKQILRRYPRITAHLICESLGYFTPRSAANALIAYLEHATFYCEWYSHMTNLRCGNYFHKETNMQVVQDVVNNAIAGRARHHGYMADYARALALVQEAAKGGREPALASWF